MTTLTMKRCRTYGEYEARLRAFLEQRIIDSLLPHQSTHDETAEPPPNADWTSVEEYLPLAAADLDRTVAALMAEVRREFPGRPE